MNYAELKQIFRELKHIMIIPLVQQAKRLAKEGKEVVNLGHETRKRGKGTWRR